MNVEEVLIGTLERRAGHVSINRARLDPRLQRLAPPPPDPAPRPRVLLSTAVIAAATILGGTAAYAVWGPGADQDIPVSAGEPNTPAVAMLAAEVFIRPDATQAEIESLGADLKQDPRVTVLDFRSREDAYELLIARDPSLADEVSPSVLPPSYRVMLNGVQDREQFRGEYQNHEAVYSVEIQGRAEVHFWVEFDAGLDPTGSADRVFGGSGWFEGSVLWHINSIDGLRVANLSAWSDHSRPALACIELIAPPTTRSAGDVEVELGDIGGVRNVTVGSGPCDEERADGSTESTEPS